MSVGLTTGEIVTAQLRFYVNAGSSLVAQDADLRERALYLLQEESDQAWTRYLWAHRLNSTTVTITSGVGSVPADVSSEGTQGHVYIQNTNLPPLAYEQPGVLRSWLKKNPTAFSQYPTHYTFDGIDATTGLMQILTWPVNSTAITLEIKDYLRRAPTLIDYAAAPVVADSGIAGLPNAPAYTWKIAFVTASGSTEVGLPSASLGLSLKKGSLTDIPTSPCHDVLYRDIYRNASGGVVWKKVDRISDNVTTTYTDNVADGSLGADAPTPATAITGMEMWPADFHRSVLGLALRNRLMGSQGDLREAAGGALWEARLLRMWADQQTAQNQAFVLPVHGRMQGMTGRTARQRMPH